MVSFRSFRTLIALALSPLILNIPTPVKALPGITNTIYIVPNAETPSMQLPGLTPVGLDRAENCLPDLLDSLDIGIIITCPYDPESGRCLSTMATVEPLATALGLSGAVDASCSAGEEANENCVAMRIFHFSKTNPNQAILIVWDISVLEELFENISMNDDNAGFEDLLEAETGDQHDLIVTIQNNEVTSYASQACAGIDGQAPGTFTRRSLPLAIRKRMLENRNAKAQAQSQLERSISSRIARRDTTSVSVVVEVTAEDEVESNVTSTPTTIPVYTRPTSTPFNSTEAALNATEPTETEEKPTTFRVTHPIASTNPTEEEDLTEEVAPRDIASVSVAVTIIPDGEETLETPIPTTNTYNYTLGEPGSTIDIPVANLTTTDVAELEDAISEEEGEIKFQEEEIQEEEVEQQSA